MKYVKRIVICLIVGYYLLRVASCVLHKKAMSDPTEFTTGYIYTIDNDHGARRNCLAYYIYFVDKVPFAKTSTIDCRRNKTPNALKVKYLIEDPEYCEIVSGSYSNIEIPQELDSILTNMRYKLEISY